MRRFLVAALLSLAAALPAAAQSTAINGSIEGVISDESGAVLPGVTVTITNLDTGDTRVVVTNESGLYRAPLLSLGKYKVEAELQGFKKLEQTGINISAGQTAVISMKLGVGMLSETIQVTADAPLVDLGKIEQGRTLTEAEIKTLPLTSRNPYNFALLQPGVVGFENQEFGVPRITSNGALLRVNYQIDGSNNTQKDRAGLRQMPMSEVMIREVKVVTTGYAPEFGQTMGMIYNAITPSGTNTFKGQGSYRLQRKSMVAFPFFTQGVRTSDNKPPTEVNVYTFDLGGPIVKNKTHFFGGYEHTERDLSGGAVITITPANAAALGLNEPRYMPRGLNTEFAIGKIDHQINDANRMSVRYIFFDNFINNNVGGGIGSVQRATDFFDRQHSTAAQLISTIRPTLLNELRVQYATRAQSRAPGSQAGTGPAINIANVANFGGPVASLTDAGFGFTQDVAQVNNSLTWLRGDHSIKGGFDIQHIADTRTSTPFQLYTFPTIAAYQAAANGTNRFGYNTFTQYFGEPNLEFSSNTYGLFLQDDWRVTDSLKVLYGLRYDLYDVPAPDANAPFETSRDFVVDKNNIAPRLGVVWTVGSDRRTVVRANTGIMYDQALLAELRAGAHQQRHQRPRVGQLPARDARCSGVSGCAVGRRRRPAEHAHHGVARLPGRQQLAEQPADRTPAERPLRGLDRHLVRARLQPADHQQHQRDQPDRPAVGRPPDLQHRGQRADASRPALQRHQPDRVARRVDLPELHRAAHRPQRVRPAVRLRLHARQGRGQRAHHRCAVGAG